MVKTFYLATYKIELNNRFEVNYNINKNKYKKIHIPILTYLI